MCNVLVSSDTDASSSRFAETGHFIKSISVILNLSLQPVLEKCDEWSFIGKLSLLSHLHQLYEPQITVF